jgi:Flp pilus assembly protein TadB
VSPVGSIVALTAVGVAGVLLVIYGWLQPAPSLRRTIEHLQRSELNDGRSSTATSLAGRQPQRLVPPLVRVAERHPGLLPTSAQLQLVGRSIDQHVVYLVVAALGGFVLPPLAFGLLQSAGTIGVSMYIPMLAAIGFALLGPLLVHTATVERAVEVRTDLRYQVSAYLDVVTMLLAGNTGYEGALEQAAHAGDGRLFAELRRRMRESGARGLSLTDALHRTGRELGLDELEQIAATAALSAAEGAPVARTLAAKCATLRTALATEQESEARLRTSRLTTPIVGMALIFMALVIYPALSFS